MNVVLASIWRAWGAIWAADEPIALSAADVLVRLAVVVAVLGAGTASTVWLVGL